MENLELQQVRSDPEWDKYLREYEMLFLDVLGVAVFENSRSISYTPSSTSNGWSKLDFSKRQPITQRYYNVTEGEIYGNTGTITRKGHGVRTNLVKTTTIMDTNRPLRGEHIPLDASPTSLVFTQCPRSNPGDKQLMSPILTSAQRSFGCGTTTTHQEVSTPIILTLRIGEWTR
jgi:hypothetical protein